MIYIPDRPKSDYVLILREYARTSPEGSEERRLATRILNKMSYRSFDTGVELSDDEYTLLIDALSDYSDDEEGQRIIALERPTGDIKDYLPPGPVPKHLAMYRKVAGWW